MNKTELFLTMAVTAVAAGLPGQSLANTQYRVDADWLATQKDHQNRTLLANKSRDYFRVMVYEDANHNGKHDADEAPLAGVAVSNGRDVVRTEKDGMALLPAEVGMSVFLTKPAGYDVPVDHDNVPKFYYHHLPEGSPALRFGGLAPTGDLPERIDFGLIKGEYREQFQAVIIGDTQPYSNQEVSYVRDSLAKEFSAIDDLAFVMVEGDVMGDDLGLFPRFKRILSVADAPQYYVAGNHDLDFDATDDRHSFDTFKREWGPTYYSFDIGEVHFVVLDNVKYPCTPEDNTDGKHAFCDNPEDQPTYNGVISDTQMTWLINDLNHTDEDKLVVVSMHIPPVSYVDMEATKHQTDNVTELYEILDGRKALLLSGHTHTIEHFRPGEYYSGWEEANGSGPTPIPQIITGAGAGSWWTGDFDNEGVPEAYQRLGAPRGYFVFDFDGNSYTERFKAAGMPSEKQIGVSILSPTFMNWFDTMLAWIQSDPATRSDVPPLNNHDLPDTRIVTDADMAGGSYLMANVWNGSRDSQVWVTIDDREPMEMTRTQEGEGEKTNFVLDPYALERQMYVYRFAAISESGDERAQGFELFQGDAKFGPTHPQPMPEWLLTTRSNHLWQVDLPTDLARGIHTATVKTTDAYGKQYQESFVFEVASDRPSPYARMECHEAQALELAAGKPVAACQQQ